MLTKTKLLKLLYILDEVSIKRSGIPLLNLKYKAWKFGPVSEELFIDLSSEPSLLRNYVKRELKDNHHVIVAAADFNDEEFSDNDIALMNLVIEQFGNKTSKELVSCTHRKNSPWHITVEHYAVLDLLEKELINNTDYVVDLSVLVAHDEKKKQLFKHYQFVN